MIVGVLEQDDHVPLGGIEANTMDKTAPSHIFAFERGKIDIATVLHEYVLGTCETMGGKNQCRCGEQRGYPRLARSMQQ